MRTIHVQTELPADADRVWQAMTHAATLSYLCRGMIGLPALAGRTEPFIAGETGTGWLMLFHVIPLHWHTIQPRWSTRPLAPSVAASTAA